MEKKTIGIGVEVELADGGNEVTVFEDRSLMLVSGSSWVPLRAGKIVMTITVDRTKRLRGEIYVLNRHDDIHATPMENLEDDPWHRKYEHTLQIRSGKTGLYTVYKENHVKLLELYKGGKFRIWELGITMRGKRFYLICQAVYDEKAYRDGDMVVIPAISRWQSLRKIMFLSEEERSTSYNPAEQKKAAEANGEEFIWPFKAGEELPANLLELKNLEPVSKYVLRPVITAEGLQPNQGRVLYWNDCHGIGGIITAEGTASVHRTKLTVKNELISFQKGDVVTFKKLVPPSDERTQFRYEAVGVYPNGRVEKMILEEIMAVL